MKKVNLLSNTLLIILSSLTITARAQNTVLTGRLKGLSNGIVEINYNKDGTFKTDSVKAINDVFTWKTNLDGPISIGFTVSYHSYSFFVGPGHMTLTDVKDSSLPYKLSGSPMQDDAEAFSTSIKDLTDQQEQISTGYNNASAGEKAVLNKKMGDLRKQREDRAIQFITNHPKSFFSIHLIDSHASFGSEYAELKPLYDQLDESVKQTVPGKKLAYNLDLLKKSRIGTQMTDFTQADTSGNPVKYSSFKGKYVLVDFWASWCAPCRAENPNVLKAYNAYKDKGFTVIGISLDDKGNNWKKAIRDDRMPWTQLSDLKGWKNAVSTDFGINSIPSNLLIDPSGKIVGRDLHGPMLESKLRQLMN
jgi:peroxiredoxin